MDIDEINRLAQGVRRTRNLDARHKELLRLLDELMAMWNRLDARFTEYLADEMKQLDEERGK